MAKTTWKVVTTTFIKDGDVLEGCNGMMVLLAAVISAAVALIVAYLTPAATSLRNRRQVVNERFDSAIASLLLLNAYRHLPTGISMRAEVQTDEERRLLDVEMFEKGVQLFVEQMARTKACLAGVVQYVPDVRESMIGGWEIDELSSDRLSRLLESARKPALRAERLLRQRRQMGPTD